MSIAKIQEVEDLQIAVFRIAYGAKKVDTRCHPNNPEDGG